MKGTSKDSSAFTSKKEGEKGSRSLAHVNSGNETRSENRTLAKENKNSMKKEKQIAITEAKNSSLAKNQTLSSEKSEKARTEVKIEIHVNSTHI